MFIRYKGKGILIPFYVVACIAGLLFLTMVIEETFFQTRLHISVYELAAGCGILLAGFWTQRTTYDYYRDEHGEKKYMDLDHRLYFIHMRYWNYILYIIGGVILADDADKFIRHLTYIL